MFYATNEMSVISLFSTDSCEASFLWIKSERIRLNLQFYPHDKTTLRRVLCASYVVLEQPEVASLPYTTLILIGRACKCGRAVISRMECILLMRTCHKHVPFIYYIFLDDPPKIKLALNVASGPMIWASRAPNEALQIAFRREGPFSADLQQV